MLRQKKKRRKKPFLRAKKKKRLKYLFFGGFMFRGEEGKENGSDGGEYFIRCCGGEEAELCDTKLQTLFVFYVFILLL